MRRFLILFLLFVSLTGARINAADLMRNFYIGEPIEQIAAERTIRYTHYWQQSDCDVYISYLEDGEDQKLEMGTFAKADVSCYRFYVKDGRLAGLGAHLKDRSVWNSFTYADFKRSISGEYGAPIVDEGDVMVAWDADGNLLYMMKIPVGNMISISIVSSEIVEMWESLAKGGNI